MAHVVYTSVYSKMDIRSMVTETIRRGADIDRPVEGSNTLLHLAVYMNLCKSVGKLLSAGADPKKENDEGETAASIALDNGNQMILQALSLRDEFTVHLRLFNHAQDVSNSRGSMASMASELCTIVSKMIPIQMPVPYEDYMDWTDSQRCRNLQALMESSRSEEKSLRHTIDTLTERRNKNNLALIDLHALLREREHALCIQVWEAIQSERSSRRAFERATSAVANVKMLIQNAQKYVHYFGIVRVAPFKRVLLKSWHRSFVEITGSSLVIGLYHDENASNNKGFSFSMSYKKKRTNSIASTTTPTSANTKNTDYKNTSNNNTNHPNKTKDKPRVLHDSEDCDTDGSNTAASYNTDEIMAAHALGTTGLPVSPNRIHSSTATLQTTTTTTNTTTNTSTASSSNNTPHTPYTRISSTTTPTYIPTPTPTTSRLSESDTLLAPLRRQFQKLHDTKGQCRSISIQDIVAVEVCKIDKSLGSSYLQVELRIHYYKDGQVHNSLLMSPVPVPSNHHTTKQHTNTTNTNSSNNNTNTNNNNNTTNHAESRERLHSTSSNTSSNSLPSRSTSASSVSNTVSNLLAPFKHLTHTTHTTNTNANGTTSTTKNNKHRSLSTGGSANFTPIANNNNTTTHSNNTNNTSNNNGSNTDNKPTTTRKKTSAPAISHIPSEKLEVVWFKLPMQTNTITSRALAKGRADDSHEGPTLTFELFVHILKRIKSTIKVFSINNNVETTYRVNAPYEEQKTTTHSRDTSHVPIRMSSFSSPAKTLKRDCSSPYTPTSNNNTSFYRKTLSSGDLVSMDSSTSNTINNGVKSPRHAMVGSNTSIFENNNNNVPTENSSSGLFDSYDIGIDTHYTTTTTTMTTNTTTTTSTTTTQSARIPILHQHPPTPTPTNTTTPIPQPLDLSLSPPNSSRSDSGSISPKRNANSATFSSVLSLSATSSGTYAGGNSMNSASGLTSIESLVGMAHRSHAHTSHNSSSSMNSSSSSTSASMYSSSMNSSSMNSSSLHSHSSSSVSYTTSSFTTTGGSYTSYGNTRTSPRYETKLTGDVLYEETSADIEAMLEEDELSDRPSCLHTDDDTSTHSFSSHSPRFLKLSRRYTEGDQALNDNNNNNTVKVHVGGSVLHPSGINGGNSSSIRNSHISSSSSSNSGAIHSENPSIGHASDLYGGVRGCSFASNDGGDIFRDVDSGTEDELPTHRHTITSATYTPYSHLTAMPTTHTTTNNNNSSSSGAYRQPSTPPGKTSAVHRMYTAGQGYGESQSLLLGTVCEPPLSYSAPPILPTHRDDKNTSSNGNNNNSSSSSSSSMFALANPTTTATATTTTSSPRSPRNTITGLYNNSSQHHLHNTSMHSVTNHPSNHHSSHMSDEELIRHPAKLARMLERARAKRSKIEDRLVDLLISREKLREVIQYLQSLRAIVDNPPPTPTRSLAKTKAPSIDKAMQLLNVFGDHINHVTEGLSASSVMHSGGNTSEMRGRLYDAEEFVRIMLQVNSNTTSSGSMSTHTTHISAYGADYANYNYDNNSTRESFTSTSSRGANHSVARRVGNSVNSINTLNTYNTTNTSTTTTSPYIRRLFTEETIPISNAMQSTSGSYSHRPSLVSSPVFPSEPTPQLLRSPPPGYKAEFISVMSQLERIWECELEAFHAVEQLATCLDQRGRTWHRLKQLREQEQSMVLPTKHDLYDIEF